jgi:hypothetical protein
MDKQSELLIRSALHDMANVLAGVQGILELSDPGRPLGTRDRDRLEAVVEEGMATLARARHLALGTLPEALIQDGTDWRAQLADELRPMSILFRCQFEFISVPGAGPDRWPGTLFRSYVRAAARQMLPYVQGSVLTLRCEAAADAWRVRLRPVSLLPEGLVAVPEDRPGDISGRWALYTGAALGLEASWAEDILTLTVPRRN